MTNSNQKRSLFPKLDEDDCNETNSPKKIARNERTSVMASTSTSIISSSLSTHNEREIFFSSSITKNEHAHSSARQMVRNGLYLSTVECLGQENNCQALSLFELIRLIRPIASIHFNFCIDPEWVLRQYTPSLRQNPIAFVVGQTGLAQIRQECAKWPNVQCAGAQLPFPYGTHHAKLSLFESEQAMHVVVSTANLVAEDWSMKTQMFYHYRAPFRPTNGNDESPVDSSQHNLQTNQPSKEDNNIHKDLTQYLREAYPKGSGKAHEIVAYWLDRIIGGQADFSECNDRLIGSIPGRFNKFQGKLNHYGHMKLRATLGQKFTQDELQTFKAFTGQFSSIGSLGQRADSWLCDEFLTSLSGTKQMLPASSMKLIYPTVENVRQSLEGYGAGFSLPYSSMVHKRQPYLRTFLHQWKSEGHARSAAMPHVKTYSGAKSGEKPEWLLVTSANLSGSAWGKLEKCGDQLFVRSYELGVLLCAKDHPDGLLLPYDLPLTKYANSDEPFLADLQYPKLPPDHNGFKGVNDIRAALM